MEELLIDLHAIQEGRAPLQARQKFNIETLEQLEEGRPVEIDTGEDRLYTEEAITRYRIGLVVLLAIIAVLIVFFIAYIAVS